MPWLQLDRMAHRILGTHENMHLFGKSAVLQLQSYVVVWCLHINKVVYCRSFLIQSLFQA